MYKNDITYNWCKDNLSRNPNITFDIIKNNPEIQWSWSMISENKNITMDIIENNPHCKWDLYYPKFKYIFIFKILIFFFKINRHSNTCKRIHGDCNCCYFFLHYIYIMKSL